MPFTSRRGTTQHVVVSTVVVDTRSRVTSVTGVVVVVVEWNIVVEPPSYLKRNTESRGDVQQLRGDHGQRRTTTGKARGSRCSKPARRKVARKRWGASLDKKGHSRGVWNAFCRSCIGKSKAHPCKTDSTEIRDASTLRRHLFRTREAKCSECKLREWQSQPIPLEVGHLDGKASNNAEIGAEGFLSSLISRRGFTMRIPVTLEEGVPAWTQEACCFCGTPTLFWTALTGRQEGEQVACCQSCAGKYRAEDVPSKRYWFLVSSWLR